MKIRRVISLTMFLGFIVMVYTGVMLFICPHGRVAYWTGWRLFGLSKEQYGALHTTFMLVFIAAGFWHITLNWKSIKNYLKNRSRELKIFTREFNVALLLALVFAIGTLTDIVPWSSLLQWEDSIKDYWEHRDGSPPWGHAEQNTLVRFTRGLVDWERLEHGRNVSLTVKDALASLRSAGLTVESEEQQLIDIARANSTTPQAIMSILREAELPLTPGEGEGTPARTSKGPFPMPFSGLGRMTLVNYCEKYRLDVDSLLILFPGDIVVDPEHTLRSLADELGTDPQGFIEMLNKRAMNVPP